MASITQTVPNYALGISEQPDQLKFPGQVKDVNNAIPDVTKGLFKRPGSKRIGTSPLSSVQSGGSWFHYYRDETEGSYIGQVAADGQVRVWRCSDGTLMTTAYGTGGQTALTNYLATNTPENLQFLTINDTTFVTNRDATNSNTAVGTTGTTTARPDTHFAFLELLRTENGRQYGVNVYNSEGSLTTVNRATRVKIQSDTLDESDGTGSCPGIGTQVFSVDAAASYTGTTTNYVHDVSGHAPQVHTFAPSAVNVGTEHITINNHGLTTGEEVVYSTSGSAIGNLPVGTYFVVKISDDVISLAPTLNDANNDTVKNLQSQGSGTHTLDCKGVLSTSGKNNLIFRLNTLGQQGVSPNYNASSDGPDGDNYRCSYQRDVILLHGGEGWVTGDVVNVTLDSASGGASGGGNATYSVRVEDHESTQVKANLGLIRPEPTPFDADTAVTGDTILGGIIADLPAGITARTIGTGIYLSSNSTFNVEVVEEDLMRVMQSSVNDVTKLPNQCRHGYIVKISNSRMSDEDDYYLRFDGENNKDGTGSWTECAKPGIVLGFDNATMPIVIQRTATTTFTVKQFDYENRTVGDDLTNPMPTFVGSRINKVLFFRNRLAFLSGENVILSRPGTLGLPDFFIETALTVSAADSIDISAASMFPSDLFDGIELNSGLVVFSTNQQFLLASDDTVLNPDTAKLRSIATFNYNKNIAPISLGTTVGYVDNSNKFSRFNEMANVAREGEPNVVEVSKIVPTLLPKDIDLLTNSRENSMVLYGKTGSNTVFGYRYFQVTDKRTQAAWFKWTFKNNLIYHFIIDDEYFFLDSNYYLQSVKLVQDDTDPSIVLDGTDFQLNIDNHTTVSGGSYNATTNLTTFSSVSWLSTVTNPFTNLVVVDTDAGAARVGRYGKPTSTGSTSFTLPGNWSGVTLKIGYIYEYSVKLPRIYPTAQQGENIRSDLNSSLVIHRVKFHFGKVGLYETTLERVGKTDYTEVYESSILDEYDVSDAPYLDEYIKTVPVYERNINVDITLKSSHPAPATLRAMSWEGDYSPRYYKRV